MVRSLFILIVGFGFLVGCRDTPCTRASAFVGFVGFQDHELDTVILHRYVKGSQFAVPADSAVFTRSADHFQRSGDTVLLLEVRSELTSDADYVLTLPKASKSYRLKEMYEPMTGGGHNKLACVNPIRSYRINDQLVEGKDRYDEIYLVK